MYKTGRDCITLNVPVRHWVNSAIAVSFQNKWFSAKPGAFCALLGPVTITLERRISVSTFGIKS